MSNIILEKLIEEQPILFGHDEIERYYFKWKIVYVKYI